MSTPVSFLQQITPQPMSDLTSPVHSIPTLTASRIQPFSLPAKSKSRRDTSNKIALYASRRALTLSRRSNYANTLRWTSIQRNINSSPHRMVFLTTMPAVTSFSSMKTLGQTTWWTATAAAQTRLAQDHLAVHIQLLVSRVCRLQGQAQAGTREVALIKVLPVLV
jgi:hypothetical protein